MRLSRDTSEKAQEGLGLEQLCPTWYLSLFSSIEARVLHPDQKSSANEPWRGGWMIVDGEGSHRLKAALELGKKGGYYNYPTTSE